MNTLLLVCHPAKDSLNHAIAASVEHALSGHGHEVRVHDLYDEGFDPILSPEELRRRFSFDEITQRHTNDLRWAGLLVFVYPDWWGFGPAMLKGWIDRVFRPGVAYDYVGEEFETKRHVGLLSEKAALVLCTTNASEAAGRLWGDSIFPFCGITRFHVEVFQDVRRARLRTRRQWLERAARLAGDWAEGNLA